MDFSFTIEAFDVNKTQLSVEYTSSDVSHSVETVLINLDASRADDKDYVRGMVIAYAPIQKWREVDKVAALSQPLVLSDFTTLVSGTDLDVTTTEVDDAFPTL